ncbi:transposase, partial [Escherichia coli]|nr:transposase [Escherichia coli]
LSQLLVIADFPRSTFYCHVKRLNAPDPYPLVKQVILRIHHRHKGRYGYRPIRLACRNEGILLNGKTIRKLMKSAHLSDARSTVPIVENRGELVIIY